MLQFLDAGGDQLRDDLEPTRILGHETHRQRRGLALAVGMVPQERRQVSHHGDNPLRLGGHGQFK
jgi:hypothetical protein